VQAGKDVAVVAACPCVGDEADALVRCAGQLGQDRVPGRACRTDQTLRAWGAGRSGRSRRADRADRCCVGGDQLLDFLFGVVVALLKIEISPMPETADVTALAIASSPVFQFRLDVIGLSTPAG
jgi:hypothetical protein